MLQNQCLIHKGTIYSPVLEEDIINLAELTFNIPEEGIYVRTIQLDDAFSSRPDLLAYSLYEDDTYGDLICKFNGISNPFELNSENLIDIPDVKDLQLLMTADTWDDEIVTEEEVVTDPNNYDTVTVKTKKEKRSANEAVIGDERFEINYGRRVVVY